MDSVNEHKLDDHVFKIKVEDQNTTDFEKTIDFLRKKQQLPAMVYGVNGKNIDRILDNLLLCIKHELFFYDEPILGIPINCMHTFSIPPFSKISIIGNAIISTDGLVWDLNYTNINFLDFLSISNRSNKNTITINVHTGKAILCVYLKEE